MNQTPYRAVFFDLDGTLLPMELDEFMSKYMEAIGVFVAEHGLDKDLFGKGLHAGIRAMAEDDSGRANDDVFWEKLFEIVPGERDTWIPLFNEFYANQFGAIGDGVVPNPFAAQAIATLQEKGYPVVLATMPMFPLRAVEWRCEWAGVDPAVFERITHFANSTSVKPKLDYYSENLKAGGVEPEAVLMVGNNTREDLAAMKLGVDGYLIVDHLMNPNDFDVASVKNGTFEEFAAWVATWPDCADPAESFDTGVIAR